MTEQKQKTEAGPFEILFFRFLAWATDYAVISGVVVSVLFVVWVFEGFWFVVVAVVGVAVWWHRKDWEKKWRQRRVIDRRWKGVPPSPGVAHSLGLSNSAGSIPRLRTFKSEAGIRELAFALPPGVTAESFEKVRSALADALGAHRCQVEKIAPGQVRVRLVDVDAMETPRDAGWAKDVVLEENSFETLPDGGDSWFEKGGSAS